MRAGALCFPAAAIFAAGCTASPARPPRGDFATPCASPGCMVHVLSAGGTISSANTDLGTVVRSHESGSGMFALFAGGPDSAGFVVGEGVSVFEGGTGAPLAKIGGVSGGVSAAWIPSRRRLVTVEPADAIAVVDTSSRSVLLHTPVATNLTSIVASPDGSFLYVASDVTAGTNLRRLDTQAFLVASSMNVGAVITSFAVAPDGTTVLVSDWASGEVRAVNAAAGSGIAVIGVGSHPGRACFSADGSFAYVPVDGAAAVKIIATSSWTEVGGVAAGMGAFASLLRK